LIAELGSAGIKTFPLGRVKRKGVGGKEFLPARLCPLRGRADDFLL